MTRRKLLFGSTAIAAALVVGTGSMVLASGGTSLVSNTVPSSQVAASTTTTPTPPAAKVHPHGPKHRGWARGFSRGVYSETVLAQKAGGYKTIVSVKGTLTAISATSVSVKRPDTGALITASISTRTKFPRTSEAALAADIAAKKAVNVRLVDVGGTAVVVILPPAPGTVPAHPKHGKHPVFPAKGSTTSSAAGATA